MAKLTILSQALVLVAVLFVSTPVEAEQSEPPPEAVEAARRGRELFEAGRYREARIELEEAYRLFPAPPLLHNIGRCMEEMGEWCAAHDAYVRFLQEGEPSGEIRAEVVRSIAELEMQCEESRRRSPEGTEGGEGTELPPPDGGEGGEGPAGPEGGTSARLFGGEPAPRSTRTTDLAGAVLMGVGAAVALAGASVWFYAISRDPRVLPGQGEIEDDSREALRPYAIGADVVMYTGIAVAATGLVVLLLGRYYLPTRAGAGVSMLPGGMLALSWP